jgi:hypothetical protein
MPDFSDDEPKETPDLFRPTFWRCVIGAVAAFAAFFVPQEIPLEWYPLNNPSSGLRYLEIKCAANTTGNVQIFLNTGRGINELEKIAFPIGPSEMTFTYTFPLADAPLQEMRLDPLDKPGELLVEGFRLINRRGEELRRFTIDDFRSQYGLSAIEPTQHGWKMIVNDPHGGRVHIDFSHFSDPEGMNERNFKRCLLSTSYLAMMLWIILLAVFFAFRAPEAWSKTFRSMAFLAWLGIVFAFVGNRGLIRNSIRYARTELPPAARNFRLELDVNASQPDTVQLFWDSGKGFNEEESTRTGIKGTRGMETLRLGLPSKSIRALRLDPFVHAGTITLRRVRLVDSNGDVRATFTPDVIKPQYQIAKIEKKSEFVVPDSYIIETEPNATDPNLGIDSSVVDRFNSLQSAGASQHSQ